MFTKQLTIDNFHNNLCFFNPFEQLEKLKITVPNTFAKKMSYLIVKGSSLISIRMISYSHFFPIYQCLY